MGIVHQHAALYTDFYELAMAQGYYLSGRHTQPAGFDYFFRKLPFKGGYVIFAGLHDLLEILQDLKFGADDLEYLKSLGFRKEFLTFLKDFRFTGSLFSVREGDVIFPYETVIRVEGNALETQVIETVLLNILNFESLIATKASRVRQVAGTRSVIDFGLRRAQGLGGIHASRAAIIGGANSTSNVYSARAFDLKTGGTMAHSWVEIFENEQEAFRAFAKIFPHDSVFLVDTYNTLSSGIPNAITVAREMEKEGHRLNAIRLDSGDLAYLSRQARALLDNAGLPYVKIMVSNQLDEYIIKSLNEQGAPIDAFGVGTNLVVGKEDAALDGVYKLSLFNGIPKIKISDNLEKVVFPGFKKVYRYLDENENFYADAIVGITEEDVNEMVHPFVPNKKLSLKNNNREELLVCVMRDGQLMQDKINPYDIQQWSSKRLSKLLPEHKRFENPHIYKVGISHSVMNLREQLVTHYLEHINVKHEFKIK